MELQLRSRSIRLAMPSSDWQSRHHPPCYFTLSSSTEGRLLPLNTLTLFRPNCVDDACRLTPERAERFFLVGKENVILFDTFMWFASLLLPLPRMTRQGTLSIASQLLTRLMHMPHIIYKKKGAIYNIKCEQADWKQL